MYWSMLFQLFMQLVNVSGMIRGGLALPCLSVLCFCFVSLFTLYERNLQKETRFS
jgi:hypothetical protein